MWKHKMSLDGFELRVGETEASVPYASFCPTRRLAIGVASEIYLPSFAGAGGVRSTYRVSPKVYAISSG